MGFLASNTKINLSTSRFTSLVETRIQFVLYEILRVCLHFFGGGEKHQTTMHCVFHSKWIHFVLFEIIEDEECHEWVQWVVHQEILMDHQICAVAAFSEEFHPVEWDSGMSHR